MKNKFLAIVVCLFVSPVFAATPVVIDCFRGPWKEVIWDHPKVQFIETLMENGYSLATAMDIANYICRDETIVGKSEEMKAKLIELMREVPRDAQ